MLEGKSFGISRKEIRKDQKEVAKAEEKPKFNFKTVVQHDGEITRKSDTITKLDTMTVDEIADWWKVLYIRKTLTPEQMNKYKDICYYLTTKYHVDLPKKK